MVWVLSTSVQGATILTENFDALTQALNVTSAGAFTATSGNVDIIGTGGSFPLCFSPESGNCLDLDGSTAGTIQTASITLNPGVNYFLSYDLIGSQRGTPASATVSFGPYTQTFTLNSADTTGGIVTNQLVTVGSTTSTRLIFTSTTPGAVGLILDNVAISSGSAVPEPSSLYLMAPALLVLGLLRRRATGRG